MKTAGIIILVVFALFLLGYFGFLEFLGIKGAKCNPLRRYSYGNCKGLEEGSDCNASKSSTYIKGIIKEGVCVQVAISDNGSSSGDQNPNPTVTTVEMVEVINPNGTYMYYKQPANTEGVFQYGKSNVLIPPGAKLTLIGSEINTYQGLPAKVVETTYKQYGNNSGFFDLTDLKKI